MVSLNEFAEQLLEAGAAERENLLLAANGVHSDSDLAFLFKDIAQAAWTTEPERTRKAASALADLSKINPKPEITALADWVGGIAALTAAEHVQAADKLERAARAFLGLKNELLAAQTRVAQLFALALVGRYEEAVAVGESALAVFDRHGDELSAGKMEKNLGNLFVRRHIYDEAIRYLSASRERFLKIGGATQIAMIDNSLAIAYALQNDFRIAESLYLQALECAEREGLAVTKAETQASLGNLALFRGRYDEALKWLEKSRSGYAGLKLPHYTVIADLEIADVYLELNLLTEAREIYRRIAPQLENFKMRAEEARAHLNFGKTLARQGESLAALEELEKAERLYFSEANPVGAATVKLSIANLHLREKRFHEAKDCALEAEKAFQEAHSPRNFLLARLVRGVSERNLQNFTEAEAILQEVLRRAEQEDQPQIAWSAATALGLTEKEQKKHQEAEEYFQIAVEIIESLRSPLAADEFRTAFFTDKLAPYQNLAEICRRDFRRIPEALNWIERARSQALLDLLAASTRREKLTDDPAMQARLDNLREELNWFYSRLNRPESGDLSTAQKEITNIRNEIRRRENEINALVLQIEAGQSAQVNRNRDFDLKKLQNLLASDRALIEFAEFEGEFAAFVVTENSVELVENLGSAAEIQEILEQIHFQFGTLRYGSASLKKHLPLLKKRAEKLLGNLYEILLRPLEDLIGEKHLIFVPAQNLHYIPFQALYDGAQYLLETREVSFAPSATVLQNLLAADSAKIEKALAAGFADERVPQVEAEVESLTNVLPETVILKGAAATFEAIRQKLNDEPFDVLHLACHGQFRAENPLFSSLHLADGWATVREAARLRLENALVVLSACETGLNEVAAGEELLGLVRGFLAAGANALVLSLWTVNDQATADLMRDFYANLRRGNSLAAALRASQLRFIEQNAHPYFWSPFVLTGRW